MEDDDEMIPLFVKEKDQTIDIISSFVQDLELKSFQGCQIVYLGKPLVDEIVDALREKLKKEKGTAISVDKS